MLIYVFVLLRVFIPDDSLSLPLSLADCLRRSLALHLSLYLYFLMHDSVLHQQATVVKVNETDVWCDLCEQYCDEQSVMSYKCKCGHYRKNHQAESMCSVLFAPPLIIHGLLISCLFCLCPPIPLLCFPPCISSPYSFLF